MVSAWVTMSSSPRPSCSCNAVGAGLQPGPELRAGAAHPLATTDLARLPGHQHHDAVGFAELVGAQHHRRVAVEAHPVGLMR